MPDFRSQAFLREHVRRTMAFYHPRCIDPAGGFFHYFKDDGRVYDATHRHLVSSTRFVFNYATAAIEFGGEDPVLGEVIAVRDMMYLSLSYDHRLDDGADAARFLSVVKARLEAGDFGGELGL